MTDKKEWINIISKLNNESSQILYLIFYLEKNNYIDYEQKIILKKFLLINPQTFLPLLNELKQTNNINKFYEALKYLFFDNKIKKDITESDDIYINKSKHLITISNDSINEEQTKDDIYK